MSCRDSHDWDYTTRMDGCAERVCIMCGRREVMMPLPRPIVALVERFRRGPSTAGVAIVTLLLPDLLPQLF